MANSNKSTQKVKGYYYDIQADLPFNAWAYIIIGGRNTGKTYSTLKYCYLNKKKFVFVKRTNEDIQLLTAGSGRIGTKTSEYGIDLSPFKSINRDLGCDVRAFSIGKGLGGFWTSNEDGEPEGNPIGYLISLNAISKFKGFDLSDCEFLIFDEFIPQPWEKVNRKEGEQLLDLYKTISRDREHRELPALKMVCLANAVSISNPVMNILEITDKVASMELKQEHTFLDEDRGIFIHRIADHPEFLKKEKESSIYKAMGNTSWGQMAFENKFAYNDLTSVCRLNMKGFKPYCRFRYKMDNYYIYMKDGMYYMTHSAHQTGELYNLNLENDQKRFYFEYAIDLREECINGCFKFELYTMYDIIINYHKLFRLK